jgi:hypothetical protein
VCSEGAATARIARSIRAIEVFVRSIYLSIPLRRH